MAGNIEIKREALLPSLVIRGCEYESKVRKPYKPPAQDARIARKLGLTDESKTTRVLGINRRAMNYTVSSAFKELTPFMPPVLPNLVPKEPVKPVGPPQPTPFTLPPDFKPLVVWEPSEEDVAANPDLKFTKIEVPPRICRWLRPHQREGVQFLTECVLHQRDFEGAGAILADDMGLGKTLQSVSLIYTMLTQGFLEGKPVCEKVIVCCPTSLVSNWKNEFLKWIGPNVIKVVALSDAAKDGVEAGIDEYLDPRKGVQVMVISYDTFRRHARRIYKRGCDLLVCDEAHRLKNAQTLTYVALHKLECRRRVLLSGTPMQNDLSEFFSMVDFTNPGVLGDERKFNRHFQSHILRGREPDATEKERAKGNERAIELSKLVNQFILRRTNVLLSKLLPPKVIQVVCCAMTPLQRSIYKHLTEQTAVQQMIADAEEEEDDGFIGGGGGGGGRRGGNKGVQVLPLIGLLKALCNHPKLVYDARNQSKVPGVGPELDKLFPPDFERTGYLPRHSGKMAALDRLLCSVRAATDDKWVLVSNYTQTLDMFETMCKYRGWGYVRLDGSTNIKKRQSLVDELTAKGNNIYVFLLSSKAGGCGLNLIGANRLVLFDPDWNPAVDKQAAARVWRDGQKKRCFVYRFLAANSIEEKVYQRQLSKEGLADVMGGNNTEAQVSKEDLRDLFTLEEEDPDCPSNTHETLDCTCLEKLKYPPTEEDLKRMDGGAGGGKLRGGKDDDDEEDDSSKSQDSTCSDPEGAAAIKALRKKREHEAYLSRPRLLWGQRGSPAEEDLANWAHHYTVQTVPDPMFRLTHSSSFVEPQGKDSNAMMQLMKSALPAVGIRQSTRVRVPLSNVGLNSMAKYAGEENVNPKTATANSTAVILAPPTTTTATTTTTAGNTTPNVTKPSPQVRKVGLSPGAAAASNAPNLHPNAPVRPNANKFEPVAFVFSCEVSGKPITGPVEEACKKASCIVSDTIPMTPRQLKKAQALAEAKSMRTEQEAAREAARAIERAAAGGEKLLDDSDDEGGGGAGDSAALVSIESKPLESEKKEQPSVTLGPKSRLPSYVVPKPPTPVPTPAEVAAADAAAVTAAGGKKGKGKGKGKGKADNATDGTPSSSSSSSGVGKPRAASTVTNLNEGAADDSDDDEEEDGAATATNAEASNASSATAATAAGVVSLESDSEDTDVKDGGDDSDVVDITPTSAPVTSVTSVTSAAAAKPGSSKSGPKKRRSNSSVASDSDDITQTSDAVSGVIGTGAVAKKRVGRPPNPDKKSSSQSKAGADGDSATKKPAAKKSSSSTKSSSTSSVSYSQRSQHEEEECLAAELAAVGGMLDVEGVDDASLALIHQLQEEDMLGRGGRRTSAAPASSVSLGAPRSSLSMLRGKTSAWM